MDKRKIVLLFLASSTFSLMVFFIIYGLFIKDSNEEMIKSPESAPVIPSSQLLETPSSASEPANSINVEVPETHEPHQESQKNEKSSEESTKKTASSPEEPSHDPAHDKHPSENKTEKHDDKNKNDKTVLPKTALTPKVSPSTPVVKITPKVPLPRIEPDSVGSKAPTPKTSSGAKATLPLPPTVPTATHSVYVRGFTSEKAAQDAAVALQQANPKNKAIVARKNGQVVLQFGTFGDKTNAENLKQELKKQNINAQTD